MSHKTSSDRIYEISWSVYSRISPVWIHPLACLVNSTSPFETFQEVFFFFLNIFSLRLVESTNAES